MKLLPRQFVAPSSRVSRRLLWGIAAPFAVSLLLTGYLYVRGQSAVERMLAEIRARGEPATPEELEAYYAVPPADQDATSLWVAALEEVDRAIKPVSGDFRRLPVVGIEQSGPLVAPGAPWPEFEIAAQFLLESAPAMQALHKAADFGVAVRYPGKISDVATTMPLKRVQLIRDAARHLMLEAYVRAHQGDAAGVVDTLHGAIMLGQSMKDEPVVLSCLVRIAVDGMQYFTTLSLLGHVEFTDEQLAALQHDLESIDLRLNIRRALCGDRVIGLTFFDDAARAATISSPKMLAARLMRPLDLSVYLMNIREGMSLTEQPWCDMYDGQTALWANVQSRSLPLHIMTNLVAFSPGMVITPAVRSECVRRVVIAALALERYRLSHGRPAVRLDALIPEFLAEVPQDPTSDKPLGYQADDSHYVVYCDNKILPLPAMPIEQLKTSYHPYLLFRWPPLPESALSPEDESNPAAESMKESP